MTTETASGKPESLPDAMLEDAAAWHARLREPERDPQAAGNRQTEFERWLAGDRRRPRAFEEVERLWSALEAPAARVLAQDPGIVPAGRPRRWPFRRLTSRPPVLAACLAVLITVGVVYQGDLTIRLNADHVTAVGQLTALTLDDGSRVTLNTDTAISVDLSTDRRQVRLLRGEAWFDVMPDGTRPFVVETTEGRIRVTGTSFGVRLKRDAAIVSLTTGRVELTPGGERAAVLTLSDGHQARLSHTGISEPIVFDGTAVTAWLRGQLVFFNAPLPEVIAELNRYRSGHIVVTNDDLDDLRISGVFRTDDPEAALTAIADTLPVRVTRLTDSFVLLR